MYQSDYIYFYAGDNGGNFPTYATSVYIDVSSPEIYNVGPTSGTYQIDRNITVWWDTNDISSNADMKVSIKRDSYTGTIENYSYRVLTWGTPNDGIQSFAIPNNITPASDWRVWVVDSNNTADATHANGTITITESTNPEVYNVRPTSGTYQIGGNITAQWNTTDIPSSANMKVSIKRDSYTGTTEK